MFADTPASAQSIPPDTAITGSVSLVSDYRFRGVSLSDRGPALQGGIEIAHSGWYAEAWASTLRTSGGPSGELDLSVGKRGKVHGFTYSITSTGYVFDGEPVYFEFRSTLGHALAGARVEAEFSYAPAQSSVSDNSYLGAKLIAPIGAAIALHAQGGREHSAFFGKKFDWEVGAGWSQGPFTFVLAMVGAEGSYIPPEDRKPAAVASVSAAW